MSSADQMMGDQSDRAREQLWLLADISAPAIAYLDNQRCFEFTNTAFKRRFGTPEAGTHAGDFFEGVCSPTVDRYLANAIERGEAINAQLDCSGKQGGTDRLRLQAVPDQAETSAAGVFVMFEEVEQRITDVDDDEAEAHRNDRLMHLQRMAKLGEMAAGLAHEVRQPLAAIANYASALRRMLGSGKSGADLISVVDQIADQAGRADTIIANARDMIGQGQSRPRRFSLQQVLDDSLNLVERRARELNVDIRVSMHSLLPQAHGNPAQIEQILLNLMTNALDAMADGEARIMHIDVDTHGANTLRVRVLDTGSGIPPERLSSVFNAFDTSKKGGMGMGLSISRALAERHGGQLWAETDIEQGASFVLELPAARDESDEAKG